MYLSVLVYGYGRTAWNAHTLALGIDEEYIDTERIVRTGLA